MRACKTAALLIVTCIGLCTLLPTSRAEAQDGQTIFSYGMRGFMNGAELGLAAGYLSTGSHYESREWRKLVFGTGIGALAGVGLGLTLGVVDDSSDSAPVGWYMLRDMGYGTLFGALVGTAVGALFLIDSGRPKDLLTGASVGALIGGGAGIAFGIVEAGKDSRHRRGREGKSSARLHLTLAPAPRADGALVGVSGLF